MNSDFIYYDMENELNPDRVRKVLVGDIDGMPIQVMCRLKRVYEELSQKQLAEIIGCSTAEISKFESGKKSLSLRNYTSMERYLFNNKYRLDDEGDYVYYDYDWNN